MGTTRSTVRIRRATTLLATSSLLLLGSPVLMTPAAEAAALADDGSTTRVGVLALAGAISAVGQTEELGAPLPLSSTSLAQVLQLDQKLTEDLSTALAGTDLEAGLEALDGIDLVADGDPDRISFTYTRTATVPLDLVYDDGDLRFGSGADAGQLTVKLRTRPSDPFVVEIDEAQDDALLRVALVGQPVMELEADVEDTSLAPFTARQGFTEVDVTGGRYRIHRDQVIRMRDPDGRGVLTLEDLRYSTLPDLFDVTTTQDVVDVRLGVELPDSLAGGSDAERAGTLTLTQDDTAEGASWPLAADATRDYGSALARATDLTRVDGLTALAQYTGTVLALQDAAEVPFPQLGGGTSDLFAPGDELLELLATAASAQIRCGAAPESPPAGLAAPGDSVYCDAVTPEGLGDVETVTWSTVGGDGAVATADVNLADAIGPAPTDVVRVDGSDGEPDVRVTFTTGTGAEEQSFTARVVPNTVQDVVRRIDGLDESTASAALVAGRLDVGVAISQASVSKDLELGNPGTLGTLVGLTGMKGPEGTKENPVAPVRATATATGATFDVGFGIQTGAVEEGLSRTTWLVPSDTSVLQIANLSATAPSALQDLPARIGFLGVTADLTGLALGRTAGSDHAVSLDLKAGSGAVEVSDLLTEEGALRPSALDLDSRVTAGISFTATESAMPGGGYATGGTSPQSGSATVSWGPASLPSVGFAGGYDALRVFDPVPATFLSGTASVTRGDGDEPDSVSVTMPAGTDLYALLNVEKAPAPELTEVARRLLAAGPSCQNVTLVDADTLTCDGLAPEGDAALEEGAVELLVLGDPFAMRDAVIEGFAAALSSFDRITEDHRTGDGVDDQYTSTLPLVDLTPAQLAVDRAGLRAGLAAVTAAAAEDEIGEESGSRPSVSSAQDLDANIGSFMPDDADGASLDFTPGTTELGVTLSAGTPDDRSLEAPLRFSVNGPGQVSSIKDDGTAESFDVDVTSDTTLAIDVVKATARPTVADGTTTVSSATLDLAGSGLRNERFVAGVGSLVTKGDANEAHLGVEVTTAFDENAGVFRTSRAKDRTGVDAAVAHLVYPAETAGDPDLVLDYTAAATDSSGGSGTAQPAPKAMQVQFLAEGLDGLAAAVDSATDGSAPRNIGPGGAPVSAPLIGTDLDAGAGIAAILTGLTSELRDELELVAVEEDTTADDLADDLEDATAAALGSADGLVADVPDVDVSVSCGTADPDCDDDGPTEWETVSVTTTVSGASKQGEASFETGLAGLAVNSDDTVDTTTDWSLPVTLRLQRGSGPQVVIGDGDALELGVTATMPAAGVTAVVGYLPATLTPKAGGGRIETDIRFDLDPDADGTEPVPYDLFDLYDGELAAVPSFSGEETGLDLSFQTLATDDGVLDLAGTITVPWNPENAAWDEQRGFGEVSYDGVSLGINKVIKDIATPFKVIDPYLAPVRDIVEVLRTPLPVISDLSELAGGDEVSLLSLLETVAAARGDKRLELAHRVIGLIDGVTQVMHAAADFNQDRIELDALADASGVLLSIDPSDVELYGSCKQSMTTTTTTTGPGGTTTSVPKKTAPAPCPDESVFEQGKTAKGAAGQTTNATRTGTRRVKQDITQKTKEVTGQIPGFSMPFMTDTDQIMDLLTGEGEASYFRIDFGTLAAQVAYTRRFGPIMAGPVPIMPFVGGSISVEGRLAMGFDSYPQTLAVEQLSSPGAAQQLMTFYEEEFDGGDVIEEGFYIDDLDADGVDVPEVKLVTTLEAGAGVSIGIVTAGLKGGVTLTLNLDLNDPDDSGRLRASEIQDIFAGDASCIFDASGEIEAFISVFVEIQLLLTSLEYEFDILRLGPYTLFEYGCPDEVPTLVVPVTEDGTVTGLALTSGSRGGERVSGGSTTLADEFEVRQFDDGDVTSYEVSGFGRVQRVDVTRSGDSYSVTVYDSAISVSTDNGTTYPAGSSPPTFVADGGANDDALSFLPGETFGSGGDLVTTAFSTPVSSLTGGDGDDTLVTGDGDDRGIDGGAGSDTIDAGLGDDVATGGSEADILGGGSGRDDLSGGDGNDRIEAGPGADRAIGGEGDDSLVGGPGRDPRAVLVIPDGEDADEIVGDQVRLGLDSGDVLVGGPGADQVDGADGSDVVVGGEADPLTTAALGDLFEDRDVRVNVLDEDDGGEVTGRDVARDTAVVPGAALLDDLCGSGDPESGAGTTDFVTGGPEADYVIGGNGSDRLDGGEGPDELCGRAGDDQLSGDGAVSEDSADPGDDVDVVRGGHGSDRADGGPGDDVLFGDDVDLQRSGTRVLDGSLGDDSDGDGDDYLDGSDGSDVIAGGLGSDLLLGSVGDDAAYGEGRDTVDSAGGETLVSERLIACNTTTRVVLGKVDLNGDLLAGAGSTDIAADTGQLAGLRVVGGVVRELGTETGFSGLLGTDVVFSDGLVDLDRDGLTGSNDLDGGDTGMIALPSMLEAGSDEGDCVLAGEGNDELLGGLGSDYLGAGEGTDLASGGWGFDLVLGDGGTDVLLGGSHGDVLVGGTEADHLLGGDGEDRLRGNEGADDLVGGSDAGGETDGQDVLLGGRENDVLAGENAVVVSRDIVAAVTDAAVPWRGAAYVPEAVTTPSGSALRFVDSAAVCDTPAGEEPDARWLTVLAHDGDPGDPEQSPGTETAYDELYGGYDCDVVVGSTGDDLVRGGQDDDLVEAGPGNDLGYGDDGDDVVLGGSSFDHFSADPVAFTTDRTGAGVEDGDDRVRGDGGPDGPTGDGDDLVAGDNALPERQQALVARRSAGTYAGPAYTLRLRDVATATNPAPAGTAGRDTLAGDGGTDRVLGQGGADSIAGGSGDDYLEGNDGGDTISGGDGADDVLGGSSAADGQPLGGSGDRLFAALTGPFDTTAAGLRDEGIDTIDSGAGADVVLGDNGRITRPSTGVRNIARADLNATGPVFGADVIRTGADADRAFGQGGTDRIDGGSEGDHLEGNEGADGLVGGTGPDVIVGGSSLNPDNTRSLDDSAQFARTQLDGNDVINGDLASPGDAASDLVLGDNATVQVLTTGRAVVQLADVGTTSGSPAALTSGDDTIRGGVPVTGALGAPDRVFGQGGSDTVTTGSAGDYVEGNAGDDTIRSGDGADDVVGGSSASDGRPLGETGERLQQPVEPRLDTSARGLQDGTDTVWSGTGDDTVLGDNGRITRPTDGARPLPNVAMADTGNAAAYGSDVLYGEDGHDVLYGQLDRGTTIGTGDRLEGGNGDDTVVGDLATVDRTPAPSLSGPRTLGVKGTTIAESVYAATTVVPQVYVPSGQATNGGPDLALGGSGNDSLFLGGGADLGNGEIGLDTVFGGDGDDALWGGIDHDRLFGGYGADELDLKLRAGDPAVYAGVRSPVDRDGDPVTHNGDDFVHGGFGPDELQADVGGVGRAPGTDQLVDWVGAYNVYYVCGGAYGQGKVIRESSPAMMEMLTDLAEASGSRELTTSGSGGWFDLGMVYNSDKGANAGKHPDYPGNFSCG